MKSFRFSFLVFVLAIFSALPNSAFALDLKTGSQINIIPEEEISGNLYVAGGQSKVEGKIDGDLSLVSSFSNISGVIEDDLTLAGRQVDFTGEVKGDLRIIGGEVFIKGKVHGDTVIVSGDIHIEDKAELLGDILIVGGKVNVSAPINNYAKIVSGHISINDSINSSVDFTTQQLVLGENSEINGTLRYFSPSKLQQSLSASINGEVQYNQISSFRDSNIFKKVVLSFINFWILLRFVTSLLLAFLLVFIFKVFSQRVNDYAIENFGSSLLTGILFLILLPISTIILFVSLIGFPVAIILILVFIFVLTISSAIAGIILGTLIHRLIKRNEHTEINFQNTTVGVILLTVLQFVPFLGDITRMVFYFVAVGSIANYLYRSIRFRKGF